DQTRSRREGLRFATALLQRETCLRLNHGDELADAHITFQFAALGIRDRAGIVLRLQFSNSVKVRLGEPPPATPPGNVPWNRLIRRDHPSEDFGIRGWFDDSSHHAILP